MPAPVRAPVKGLAPGEVKLDREVSGHLARVLRVEPGQKLQLFDPGSGLEAQAVVVQSLPAAVVCRVESVGPSASIPSARVHLVQALSRGAKLDEVVRDATALGVSSILVVSTERGPQRPTETRLGRWERIAVQAARQCGRGNVPNIRDGTLQEALTAKGWRLVLEPSATAPFSERLRSWHSSQELWLAVGPEGGFSERELESFREHGWQDASLAPFVLRTELAPTVALAIVQGHCASWSSPVQ